MERLFYNGVEVHSHREYTHRGVMMSEINISVPRTELKETAFANGNDTDLTALQIRITELESSLVCSEQESQLLKHQLIELKSMIESPNTKITQSETDIKLESGDNENAIDQAVFSEKGISLQPEESTSFDAASVYAMKDGKTIVLGILDSEEYKSKLSELKLQDKFVKSVLDGRTKQHKGYTFTFGS